MYTLTYTYTSPYIQVAGDSDGDEMSARDGEREGDDEDRIEIDADEIGGDGDEMTEEEVCNINKNVINMKKLFIYIHYF
jgi:hypothetical protein